jgi:hypothetical protein
MATFTISVDTNIDTLTGKTGGDTYNCTSGTLIIDQHSRFGLNQSNASDTAATSIGSLPSNFKLTIDGTAIRMIPFTNGSGTIPTLNTLITQGSASGKLMCVYSTDMTQVPNVAGDIIPTAGWIQIKQWNNIEYSSGALTGITADSTGVSKVGLLEIMADPFSINTGATLNITGLWYDLGLTNGVVGQSFQIPTHGTNCYIQAIFVETAVGSGVFEPYPNVSAGANKTIGTEEYRGRICWLDETTGVVNLGSSDGTIASGFTPQSGRRVVVPNIFLNAVTATARRTSQLASKPSVYYQGGGTCFIDKCNVNWFINLDTFPSGGTWIKNSSFRNTPSFYRSAISVINTIENCSLFRSTYYYGTYPIIYTKCVFISLTTNNYLTLTGIDNVTFDRCRFQNTAIQALNSTTESGLYLSSCSNILIDTCDFIACKLLTNGSDNVTVNNHGYCNEPTGNTRNNTYPFYKRVAIHISNLTTNMTVTGFRLPIINNGPDGALVYTDAQKPKNITVQNIGTFDSPFDVSSPYPTGYLMYNYNTSKQKGINILDCHIINSASGITYSYSETYNLSCINSTHEYAKVNFGPFASPNSIIKGHTASCTNSTGPDTAAIGVIVADYYDSTTSGFIALFPSPVGTSSDKITLFGGAVYNSNNTINATLAGNGVEYETSDYIIGHTGFQNVPLEMHTSYSSSITNHNYNYSIDINDGKGFSPFSATLSASAVTTALSSVIIDPAKGFKLKLRVTTPTNNQYANIRRIVARTTSTLDAQRLKYPNPIIVCSININSDASFLAGGAGKFAMYLDTMVGFDYPTNATPLIDLYSKAIAGNITSSTMTFKFGFSMNREGIRGQNENTNVVVVATNAGYTQPIIVRGTITSDGLTINLAKSNDLAYKGGI